MFIPTTKNELENQKIQELDIILISGDVYIDSPNDGTAILGKWLIRNGYKVGIISQPVIDTAEDILRLGEPKLFWGVSAGCVDSMVANYTATKKKRYSDDLTPGGDNNRRPDRAIIKYVNTIRRFSKSSKPIVIGGIEASLRRIAHYDYWDDSIRRSLLFDAKADFLIYGMAEKTILQFANNLRDNLPINNIKGLCYRASKPQEGFIELPSFEEARSSKIDFQKMFKLFYENTDPIISKGLTQKTGEQYLIHNPPQDYPTSDELDEYYASEFEYDAHPFYKSQGVIRALDTIKQSITSHRGCFGECNFCSITVHQGRRVVSRSEKSILQEINRIASKPKFNGIIYDVGGPTANMYKMHCQKQSKSGSCIEKRCTSPNLCKAMNIEHRDYIALLNNILRQKNIKKVFISSGLRYDLIMQDKDSGMEFFENLVAKHVSGQLKIAPEHTNKNVLAAMGKPANNKHLIEFKNIFEKITKRIGKKQFLTYYFIAAHPGCSDNEMQELHEFLKKDLKAEPEQIQIFTPTPSTISTLMYYTEMQPFSEEKIFSEKMLKEKQNQKDKVVSKGNTQRTRNKEQKFESRKRS